VDGFDQDAVGRMRVAVIGAGAVGNEVVKNLVLLGVGAIDVHDFDRVELHNLTRSIFLRESDVGIAKAAAVAARAAEVDPNVRLTAVEGDAWRTLGLAHAARCAAVISCVDNFEARMRLSQLALLAGVDFVNAGVDARYVAVERYPFAAAALPACYECHLPESAYRRIGERYSCGWLRRVFHAERKIPTTAITASIAGALAVQAAMQIGGRADGVSSRVLVDTRTGTSSRATLDRSPHCAACGGFTARPERIAAGRDWRAALGRALPQAEAVVLSDPVIFDYRCVRCGPTADGARYIGERAQAFDDRIMRCAGCGELAVDVDIRSEVTVAALAERFPNAAPPVKFLLARAGERTVCIDLEEDIT
jgi:molybdopterin/thiamine biosynthesis adenylyltransferase